MPLDPVPLDPLARGLAAVPGVVGVVLGGSRARGTHTAGSDVDLGVYYRPPLDGAALGALAREVAGPAATVTAPGEWGPWVDGGAWLTIGGTAVDWIYRDVGRVAASWQDARAGRLRWYHQVGHPLGVPNVWYAAEIALGRVLADPTGELARLHADAGVYPGRLAAAFAKGLFEARFALTIARKAAPRGDAAYVAGCLFRCLGLCAHAVHAHAGRWVTNEKGLITAAGSLPGAPAGFAERAHGLLGAVGGGGAELLATLDAAEALVGEVEAAVARA